MATQILLTVQQVMGRLQVSDETIYRYIRQGKLKAVHVGSLWRISPEDLEDFVKSGSGRNKPMERLQ